MNNIEETVQHIPIKAILIGDNVRTDLDKKKLDELVASITAGGVRQPVLLTPKMAAGVPVPGKYRLVYGQRRVVASDLAGKDTVPALVRELTEQEIEVEQLVENDQREDLHPLDRAAQYKKLQERGLDSTAIAERVGRARSTVEVTLRLADLVDGGRKAMREGWLSQGAAEEVAMVPPSMQGKALKDLEELRQRDELTRDTARALIRAKYFLDLSEVLFDIKDPNLVPSAGACTPTCTKRTCAQVELFGKKDGPDCCMDMPCLRIKEGAWLKQREKEGARVLSGAEVKQAFPYNDRVSRDAGFVGADEKEYGARKTFRQAAGEDKVVLARAPSGALVELVPVAALPAEKPSTSSSSSSTTRREKSAADKRRDEQVKVKRLVAARCVRAFNDANGTHLKPPQVYRAAVAGLIKELQHEARKQLCNLLELKTDGDWSECQRALEKHAKALDPDGLGAFVVQLAGASCLTVNLYSEARDEHLLALCKLTDHSLVGIQKDIELELRNAAKVKAMTKVAKKKTSKREGQLSHGLEPVLDSEREEQEEIRAGAHLVTQSGGAFYLTHAGATALGMEHGYRIMPGSPLVDELVKAEAAGKGKLNLTLQRKHHKLELLARGDGAEAAAFALSTQPGDPIQWLPKKHPKIVAVGLGHGGRRYEVQREKRRDSKSVGFFWRGGPDGNFMITGAGWGSVVDTEEKAKAGAEEHEKRAAEKGGRK